MITMENINEAISFAGSLGDVCLVVAIIGWIIERFVLSLLNNRPLDTILATWGVGIMLQQGVRLMVGSELRYVCALAFVEGMAEEEQRP